jgi:putative transposase
LPQAQLVGGCGNNENHKGLFRDLGALRASSSTGAFCTTYPLKAEHVDHEDFATRDLGTASIGDYIEGFHNCARRLSHVGYVSPIEFELRSQIKALAA